MNRLIVQPMHAVFSDGCHRAVVVTLRYLPRRNGTT
jgi:hypothetical protein